MQKTTFPIEILVHDDASIDKTKKIIEEYAQKDTRIKTIFQTENQYSQNIKPWAHFLFPLAKGKYIALCDGDDYWTDPLKLQRQVDFLEQNDGYVASWTNFKNFDGKTFTQNEFNLNKDSLIIDFNSLYSPYCTYTSTLVFEKKSLDLSKLSKFIHSKDNTIYALLLENGKGVFMNFEASVYRLHEGGVYSLKSNYFKNHSSYKNLKEILNLIPKANTKNMKKTLKSLGNATAFEVYRSMRTGENVSSEQVLFMENYFKNANFKTKFKFFKRKYFKKNF